ncbi:ABC transporter permease [Bacillus sp. AFS018417]|uniref:ABC transporter permease n=1 Tax=unclassified Bacillus (in: firmicutes) TaxID=185979 RepID=UPI000BF8B84A|nr:MULTISPECIES: ABC transporter permease [unclassified Bacillus (in: firmicutes)]MCP1125416.1 ABC transporter permease [Bacillus sp. 3103sda1]PEZ10460.1 ABC transporter permease [Bacillus sp. AFS018417]
MLNLMRLELIKFKVGSSIRGAFIAAFIIFGFLLLIGYASKSEGDIAFSNYNELFSVIDTLVRATFIIFGASLLAKIIVQEFTDKTITLLFMYPVNRQKLIIAKLLIVIVFTFFSMIISEMIVFSLFYVANAYNPVLSEALTLPIVTHNAAKLVMNAIAATGMSLIPLFFGMRKYSVRTTIISSIIIVSLVCSNNGGTSLSDIIIIPIILACIGVVIAYMTVRKVEQADLFK